MREPTYRDALSFGARFTWNHKELWLFGIFAALIGQFGILDLLSKVGVIGTPPRGIFPLFGDIIDAISLYGAAAPSASVGALFIAVVGIYVAFGIIMFALGIASQGAIIASAASVATNPHHMPRVSSAWRVGKRHAWRLFILFLLKVLVYLVIALALGVVARIYLLSTGPLTLTLLLVFSVLALLLGLAVSFWSVYAAGYIVVEEEPVYESITKGWQLFTRHSLVSLEVGLLMLLLYVVFSVLFLVAAFVFFFPTLTLWIVLLGSIKMSFVAAGILLSSLFFTLFLIILASMFSIFTLSVWTYLFMHMHQRGVGSAIKKLFRKRV